MQIHHVLGNYLGGRFPELVRVVNAQLDGSKYKVNQRVLIDAPIGENIPNTDKVKVVSNGYPFTVHKSVAKVYGLGDVVKVYGNGLYQVKIFDDKFDCKEEYMSDKY